MVALAMFTTQAFADDGCPVEVPALEEWSGSGHADADAEAFVHWDEDDPAEVPTCCAKCHSSGGYRDFLGVDGTDFGVVDNPAPIGTSPPITPSHPRSE